jgi:DNA polymerase II small subunit
LTPELQPVLIKVLQEGYQLSPEAFELLESMQVDQALNIIQRAIRKASKLRELYVIDQSFLSDLEEYNDSKSVEKSFFKPLAEKVNSQIEVDLLNESIPAGDVNGFIDYFNSRFAQIESILKRRVDVKDAIPLSQAVKLPLKTKFKTIGLVSSKNSRRNRLFIDLEDSEASTSVMISGEESFRKGLEILEDQVICFEGLRYRDNLMIANDLIWPDIPIHEVNRSGEPVCAVFLGDVHIGSKYFRKDLFQKFIDWMNMRIGSPTFREYASRVKYVVIVGDLVDGIGIYPEQLDELTLTTQTAQYEEAARLLSLLPDYVEVLVIPGNHDAVRRSLPQPPIPEKYAPTMYRNKRIHLLPNPCSLKLHGVQVLLAHGKALDDILSSTPGYDFHRPVKAVELLLRCRLIAPIYGQSTPIAPEKTDRLVIKEIPDVFVMGHIHIYETRKYKGVTLISSGSFQDQTPFQRRMKIEPTPGIVSIFDLSNHQNVPLDLERLE